MLGILFGLLGFGYLLYILFTMLNALIKPFISEIKVKNTQIKTEKSTPVIINSSPPPKVEITMPIVSYPASRTYDQIAYDFYLEGIALLKINKFYLAEKKFSYAINNKPKAQYFYLRGITNIIREKHYLTLKDFNSAIKSDPSNLGYLHGRGLAYYFQKELTLSDEDFKITHRPVLPITKENLIKLILDLNVPLPIKRGRKKNEVQKETPVAAPKSSTIVKQVNVLPSKTQIKPQTQPPITKPVQIQNHKLNAYNNWQTNQLSIISSKDTVFDLLRTKGINEIEYNDLLNCFEWHLLRQEMLIRDSFKCKSCGHSSQQNHVHHKRYILNELPWDIETTYLVTLCYECHHSIHQENEIPIFERISYSNLKKVDRSVYFCSRCNGAGYFPEFSHIINGACFKCQGSGFVESIFEKALKRANYSDDIYTTQNKRNLTSAVLNNVTFDYYQNNYSAFK